jgi:hypothetical protein
MNANDFIPSINESLTRVLDGWPAIRNSSKSGLVRESKMQPQIVRHSTPQDGSGERSMEWLIFWP